MVGAETEAIFVAIEVGGQGKGWGVRVVGTDKQYSEGWGDVIVDICTELWFRRQG